MDTVKILINEGFLREGSRAEVATRVAKAAVMGCSAVLRKRLLLGDLPGHDHAWAVFHAEQKDGDGLYITLETGP